MQRTTSHHYPATKQSWRCDHGWTYDATDLAHSVQHVVISHCYLLQQIQMIWHVRRVAHHISHKRCQSMINLGTQLRNNNLQINVCFRSGDNEMCAGLIFPLFRIRCSNFLTFCSLLSVDETLFGFSPNIWRTDLLYSVTLLVTLTNHVQSLKFNR